MANLTLKSIGATQVALNKIGSPNTATIQVSKNGGAWTDYTFGSGIALANNDYVAFSGSAKFSKNIQNRYNFSTSGTGTLVLSGELVSLISGTTVEDEYEFNSLFSGCTNIVDASEFTLSSTTLNDFCYSNMFKDCTGLSAAPSTLPANNLYPWCYQGMFAGCLELVNAPTLPACSLAKYCYYAMFYNCKKLSAFYQLPAHELQDFCYTSMFYNCQNLGSEGIPLRIHGSDLKEGSCANMFMNCNKLHNFGIYVGNWDFIANSSAHCKATNMWTHELSSAGTFTKILELEVQRGEDYIPQNWTICNSIPLIFKCLDTAPTDKVYIALTKTGTPHYNKFRYTINGGEVLDYTIGNTITLSAGDILTLRGDEPCLGKDTTNFYHFVMSGDGFVDLSGELEAMARDTMSPYAYQRLFEGCKNIANVTNLKMPDSTAQGCFRGMFYNCDLVTPPQLPATTLAPSCYFGMFQNCQNLSTAPALPATSLASGCYLQMFYGCTSLSTGPDLPATELAPSCYTRMFRNCTNLSSLNVDFTSWGTNNTEYTYQWLSGVAESGLFIKGEELSVITGISNIPSGWHPYTRGALMFRGLGTENAISLKRIMITTDAGPTTISLQYSKNGGAWTNYYIGNTIRLGKNDIVAFSGSNSHFSTIDEIYRFEMTGIIEANDNIQSLVNNSSTAPTRCFDCLFSGCTSLVKAPILSATSVGDWAYLDMFAGCTNLVEPPVLPATTLGENCYREMFRGCTALTSTPVLPATTLAPSCYLQMFENCTSLTRVTLPATSLPPYCYAHMFNGCSNLTCIDVNFTAWGSYSTYNWVYGVAASGTFYKPQTLQSVWRYDRIPPHWTVVNK